MASYIVLVVFEYDIVPEKMLLHCFACMFNSAPVWRSVQTSANSNRLQRASFYSRRWFQFHRQVQQNQCLRLCPGRDEGYYEEVIPTASAKKSSFFLILYFHSVLAGLCCNGFCSYYFLLCDFVHCIVILYEYID